MEKNQKPNLPKQTADEINELALLYNRYRRDWNFARPHFDAGKKGVLHWHVYRDPESHPYKYNPAVPMIFTITESMTSSIINALFSGPNFVDILPVERTHETQQTLPDEEIATQLTRVINHLMLNPDRELYVNMEEIVKEAVLLGNGFSVNLPDFDFNRTSDIGGPVYLGPKIMQKSFFDIVPDMEGCRFSDCRWIWDIERVPLEELRTRMGKNGYKNLNDAVLKAFSDDEYWLPEGVNYFDDIQSTIGNSNRKNPGGFDKKSGIIVLLHFYDKFTGHFKTIAGNRLLIRDTSEPRSMDRPGGGTEKVELPPPYPYCPYGDLRLWSYSREFYAKGVAKIVGVYQDEVNLWKSMRYENIEMALHKVLLYNPSLGIDEDDIWMAPAATIKTFDVHNSLKELEIDDITQSSYVEQSQAEKNAYDASGNQPEGRGNLPHRREAATTVLATLEKGAGREQTFMNKLGFYCRHEVVKVALQIRSFMSVNEYERILGEKDKGFYQLPTYEIANLFDFKPSMPSIDLLRQSELQNLITFVQVAQQGGENILNLDNVFKSIFRKIMPGENPNVFILTEEQKQQKQLEMQQMMAAQNGQGGANPPGVPGQRLAGEPTIPEDKVVEGVGDGVLGGQQGAY